LSGGLADRLRSLHNIVDLFRRKKKYLKKNLKIINWENEFIERAFFSINDHKVAIWKEVDWDD